MSRRLVISINSAWNIANFRAGLIRGLQQDGWEIVAVAPADEHVGRVEALGCRFVPIEMAAGGTNPIQDLRLYRRYKAILRAERPAAYLGYTIKPNVWGGLAAQSLDIPVINNIAGLGTAFIHRSWLTHVAQLLYRLSLRRSHCVLFQNEDDRRYFIDAGLVRAERSRRVPGSGVDLQRFALQPLPQREPGEALRLLFIGRLLRDKGVQELVDAARLLKADGIAVRVQLLGFCDSDNPSAFSREDVAEWEAAGWVEYLGSTDDVRPHIALADAVVLPSYREGVPRTLLEAAALGRPLIASDAVGCRDAVDDGINGLLARPRDAVDLARQCRRLCEADIGTRMQWGHNSRSKVEREFDEALVLAAYRNALAALAV